ncbi:MAG TPA: MlaD family protein [Gemmatimonadales bacterium]|jgi:phospholipid/cholesterol/gamma-HCH transport system substrate-binding protein
MDLHYQREITVGTLVLVGIGLFVAGTMWLKGAKFRPTEHTAQVQFTEISTLQKDNEVAVSGFTVGKVAEIEFKGPGRVLVTVTLPPDLALHKDATAHVATSFFASGTRLVLNPGTDSAGPLPDGQVILGTSGSDVFAKGAQLADRADSVLIGVQAIANKQTADELTKTLQSLQRVLNTMNQRLPQTSTEAEKTMVALRRLSERLDSTIATIPVGNAVERADTLARNLSTMSIQLTSTGAQLDTLLQKMNAGQGTMGKFVTDTGLYGDSRAALQALKTLIDELNKHPGKLSIQVKLF